MSGKVGQIVEKLGQRYSSMLGIDLDSGREEELFKWFLASMLFGAPINESSVVKTYKCFQRRNALTPKSVLKTGWNGLVKMLDEGGYARYDFKTSDKLLEVMRNLESEYNGSLVRLHEQARDPQDLERRLKKLGKGIGDVTVGIFLRELRGIWEKANPLPTPLVLSAARQLGIIGEEEPRKALVELEAFWRKNASCNRSFVEFETALLRLGKDFRRRKKASSKRNCAFVRSIPVSTVPLRDNP